MKKDVFLSYASSDAQKIEHLAQALEQQGISVWWDREIPPGKTWDAVLGKALNEAKCVVVFWTKHSVASDWVKDEAARGKARKILVPALLEDAEIPLGFGRIEAADLRHWNGDTTHPEFINFVAAIRAMIDSKPVDVSTAVSVDPIQRSRKFKLSYLFIPLLIAVVAFLGYWSMQGGSQQLAMEIWHVENDRKSEMLSSGTFAKEAGLDKLETWLTRTLKRDTEAGQSPIRVNLHVPADLKSEAVQIDTDPPVEISTYIIHRPGATKGRARTPLTQQRLAQMDEDFSIEFGQTGYLTEIVTIKPGESKSESFALQPKKISVAVEHFANDRKNLARRLARRLAMHKEFKVTPPDALEKLRQKLELLNQNGGIHNVVQTALRDSLGVDFIISGEIQRPD